MSVQTVAKQFVDLCNQGKNFDVMRTLYAPDIVSVEGNGAETAGQQRVIKKSEDWVADKSFDFQAIRGPYFNGPTLSLVDAAYAPFLQRYTFMDRLRPLGIIEKYPNLAAWRDALLAAPAVKASTVEDIEAAWQENLILRNRWLAKLVPESVKATAAA